MPSSGAGGDDLLPVRAERRALEEQTRVGRDEPISMHEHIPGDVPAETVSGGRHALEVEPSQLEGDAGAAIARRPQRVGSEGDDRVAEVDAEATGRIHAAAAQEGSPTGTTEPVPMSAF